jgi:excisionase family DNA binding protein
MHGAASMEVLTLHPQQETKQKSIGKVSKNPVSFKRILATPSPEEADKGCEEKKANNKKEVDPLAYTMTAFCKLLSISESFGWKMLKDGRLACIKIGRRTLIPHSELQRLIKAAA